MLLLSVNMLICSEHSSLTPNSISSQENEEDANFRIFFLRWGGGSGKGARTVPGDGDNFRLFSGLSGSSAIKSNNNNNSNNAPQMRSLYTPEFTGATDNVDLRAPSQLAVKLRRSRVHVRQMEGSMRPRYWR